ncbi:Utp14 protein-domain-containing protein [Mortierella sp. GBAus27b]|nr:hypothetical protein BGX31_002038 [Mortierella sp. GBA43]KAI8355241.1 Utp14 protein-domain-containing protein [Mortierella sp. GBAus27b]
MAPGRRGGGRNGRGGPGGPGGRGGHASGGGRSKSNNNSHSSSSSSSSSSRGGGGGGEGGAGGGGYRKPQANNHGRKSRGAAAGKFQQRQPTIKSLANVYSLEDDDESKVSRRRKNRLDQVDDYEYHVDEIDDEDDEEIDSDDAFDEEDEAKFENFQFYGSKSQQSKKKSKAKPKKAESDDEDMMDQDDDDEEDEEDEDGAEYMDISEMLDQPEEDEVVLPKKTKVAGFNDFGSDEEDFGFGGDDDEDEEEDEEEEEDGEEDEDEEEVEDMEDEDDSKGSNLTSFIDSLETRTTKRKQQEEARESSSKKARKALRERTEAYDESEYNLQAHRSAAAYSTNSSANKKKLDISDLVGTIKDETGFSSLKKNVQALENGSKKAMPIDTLSAPLPKIAQDRLNREAAYTESKKEVSKWLPVVQKNRQAEHLAFPMNAPPVDAPSSSSFASKFDATTQMEKEVQDVLVAGGMQEKTLVEFEELALNKMSVEEVEKRRADLRMMRELMFREELRAKRVAKIKSKTFRKIKKKERERNALTSEEMADLDPSQVQEERLLAEQKRAQERMTLKHKNTGKWAKDQLKHGNFDPESRQAISEQIERGERLRRKIQGVGSDEEDTGGESEYSDFEDDDIQGVKSRAFEELAEVQAQLDNDQDAALEAKVGKGVFAMKFMQDAAKRNKLKAQTAAEEFRRELEEEEELRAQSSEDEWQSVAKGGKKATKKATHKEAVTVIGSGGRMVFGAASASSADLADDEATDAPTKAVKLNNAGLINKVALSGGHSTKVAGPVTVKIAGSSTRPLVAGNDDDSDNDANPWLQTEKHGQGKIGRKNDKGTTKHSSREDKLQAKMKKQKAADAGSDDDVQIDTSSFLTLSKDDQKERGLHQDEAKNDASESEAPQVSSTKNKKAAAKAAKELAKKAAQKTQDDSDHDMDNDSDASEAAPAMVHAKSAGALSQRELVARAFANDNVVSEFEKEKLEVMEEDKPKDVDMTLPGWGSWGGKGAKKRKNVVVKKALPGEGVEANKRKDAKLGHVIISEKRDKRSAAFSVTQIPHPFKTWEQYEQSLRTPVGKEWNTNASFQKMTLPRITTKLGTIIDPLTAPFK